jgi:hypothetical protein
MESIHINRLHARPQMLRFTITLLLVAALLPAPRAHATAAKNAGIGSNSAAPESHRDRNARLMGEVRPLEVTTDAAVQTVAQKAAAADAFFAGLFDGDEDQQTDAARQQQQQPSSSSSATGQAPVLVSSSGHVESETHLRTLHRHMHALAAEWRQLVPTFVIALPASIPGARLYLDEEGCTSAGVILDAPPLKSMARCAPNTGKKTPPTGVWPELDEYACSDSDVMTPTRLATLESQLAIGAGEIANHVQVQTDAVSLSFSSGVACGGINVTGLFQSNLVVVVTLRHVWWSDTLTSGATAPCAVDVSSRRPVMIHVNFDPLLLDDPTATYNAVRRMILHGLAFSVSLLSTYRHVDAPTKTYFEADNQTYATGPVTGTAVGWLDNSTVQVPCLVSAGLTFNAITRNTVAAARDFFGCPTLTSMPFEDLGYWDGLVFWEKRVLMGEVMTVEPGLSYAPRYISPVTVGLLRDTGWYVVADALAQVPPQGAWGQSQGCQFVSEECFDGWPRDPLYFCEDFDRKPACGFDRSFTGVCNLQTLMEPLPDRYQVFESSPYVGGPDLFANGCPYIAPDPLDSNGGYCAVSPPATSPRVDVTYRGSRRGAAAQCFLSSVLGTTFGVNATTAAVCMDTACQSGRLYVRVGEHYIECQPDRIIHLRTPRSGNVSVENATREVVVVTTDYQGTLRCPNAADHAMMCASPGVIKPNFWPQATAIEPIIGVANGGRTFTIHGENLVNCKAVSIGGVFSDVLYHFPTGTLQGRTRFVGSAYGSLNASGLGLAEVEVWCQVTGSCLTGIGCGVTRLPDAFNITTWLPCNFTDDIVTCKEQPACEWIGGLCVDRLTLPPTTPAPTPAPPATAVDKGCYSAAPRYCTATGKCAPEASLCLACPLPEHFQCWNSWCVLNQNECPCRPDVPFRCPDGSCAPLARECTTTCASGSLLCWDKSCVAGPDANACPCPPVMPTKCNVTGRCSSAALSDSWCAASLQCPSNLPVRCWDNTCAFDVSDCRCTLAAPVRCWHGGCVAAGARCSCPAGFAKDCGATVGCLPNGATCPQSNATTICPQDSLRCAEQRCVTFAESCYCSNSAYELPSIQIAAPTTITSLSMLTATLAADVLFAPCVVDQRYKVDVTWTVIAVDAAQRTVPLGIPASFLTGTRAVIPANRLTANTSYTITATATAPNDLSVYTSVMLNVQTRLPMMRVAGGYRDVDQARPIALTAMLEHDDEPLVNQIRWSCCRVSTVDAGRCAETTDAAACPALLGSVSGVTTPSVRIQAADGLPTGGYLFRAQYKTIDSGLVPVQVKPTAESCFLYMSRSQFRVSDAVELRIVIETLDVTNPDVFYSVKWTLNGSTVAGQTGLTLSIGAGVLAANTRTTVAAAVTSVRASGSQCSLVLQPRPAVTQGVCQVANIESDSGENIGVATKTRIMIHGYGWDFPSTAPETPAASGSSCSASATSTLLSACGICRRPSPRHRSSSRTHPCSWATPPWCRYASSWSPSRKKTSRWRLRRPRRGAAPTRRAPLTCVPCRIARCSPS